MNQSILNEIKSFLDSEIKDPERAMSIMRKIQEEGGELLDMVSEAFVDLLPARELDNLAEETSKCGYLALSKQDQQRLIDIVGSEEEAKNLSYYEVIERLNGKNVVEIADSIEEMAEKTTNIDYVYDLEKDLIDSEDLKESIASASDAEVKVFLARYFEGLGIEATEEEKQKIVMGLGERDSIVSNIVRLNERSVESAIKKFERSNPNIKFASLDLSAQNRILAEFNDSQSDDSLDDADFTYLTTIIQGKKSAKEKQQIAEKVIESAKAHGKTVDEELYSTAALRELVGLKAVDFKKLDLDREVIKKLDDKIFENLVSQIMKDRFDDTKEVIIEAKKRIIEQNIKKRDEVEYEYSTDIPNPSSMSIDGKRDYNYRVSLLNRHLRENPESDILKNILINTHMVNEDVMIQNMVSRQDDLAKKVSKLSNSEIKQFLSINVVNAYFSENQPLKTLMIQIGANNLFLTFSESQLKPRIIKQINKNAKLKFDAISHAYSYKKSEEELNKSLRSDLKLAENYEIFSDNRPILIKKAAIEEYLSKGKIIKEKETEVYNAARHLEKVDGIFAKELYDEFTKIVSYESAASDEQQDRFFGDTKPYSRAKNLSQAMAENKSSAINIDKRYYKTIAVTSCIAGSAKSHIQTTEKYHKNQEFKRTISIMIDKINNLSTKQSGSTYADSAKDILGEYYNKIYNAKNLVTRLIGGEVKSESAVIQQRDLLKGLQTMLTQTLKKLDSLSKYISAPFDVANDPRFIGKLTHKKGGVIIENNINYSKFSELTSSRKNKALTSAAKMQQDFMEKDPKYKAVVEEYNKRYESYKNAFDELESLTEKLNKLDSQMVKTAEARRMIKELKIDVSDAQKKVSVLEPYMLEYKKVKEDYEKKFSAKLDKEAKKAIGEVSSKPVDIFSYQNIYLNGSKTPINPEVDTKVASQIRKAASSFISSMISNVERINDTLKLTGAKPVSLKNTRLGVVVKEAGIIIKMLNEEKRKVEEKLKTLSPSSEEYKNAKITLDKLENDLSRVKNDTKTLENVLNKLGVSELKNKNK